MIAQMAQIRSLMVERTDGLVIAMDLVVVVVDSVTSKEAYAAAFQSHYFPVAS